MFPMAMSLQGTSISSKTERLKNFWKKGPKYRPSSKIDWKECRQVTKDALSSFCKKWCKREKSHKKSLDSYLNKYMNVVDKRISHYENNLELNNSVHNTPISRIRNKL